MTINKYDELEARFEGLSRALDSSRRTTRIALAASVVALAIGGMGTLNAFDLGMAPQDRSVNGLPVVLPYQGTLSKAGAPFTGTQTMQFKLYSDTSGAAFWTSDPRSVEVVGGKFAVTLGDANDANKLEAQDFRHSELYVELVVDGTTLSPMQRIAPAPQAITAAQASGDFTIPGELSTDSARINNTLTVAGDVTLGDASSDTTNIAGDALIGGSVSISGDLSSSGDARLQGELTTEANVTLEKQALLERANLISQAMQRQLELDASLTVSNPPMVPVSAPLCGLSAPQNGVFSHNGKTGLEAARSLCQATCGNSPTAHMCTAHEINISAQFGVKPKENAWFSSFGYFFAQTDVGFYYMSDCNGWTTTASRQRGLYYDVNGYVDRGACSDSRRIVCCD